MRVRQKLKFINNATTYNNEGTQSKNKSKKDKTKVMHKFHVSITNDCLLDYCVYQDCDFRIKEIAKENKVEIVENKPLARTLYATCEVGDSIPEELYQSVAEVLAFVYKLHGEI